MQKCCEDADWREEALQMCSTKISDAISQHPNFHMGESIDDIQKLISGTANPMDADLGIHALPAQVNKCFYYLLIPDHAGSVSCYQGPLDLYQQMEFVITTTYSNAHYHFAQFCKFWMEDGPCPQVPMMSSTNMELSMVERLCSAEPNTCGERVCLIWRAIWLWCLPWLLRRCITKIWKTTEAHKHLKNSVPHVGDLAASTIIMNLQWRWGYISEIWFGMAVVNNVKKEWLNGKEETDTIRWMGAGQISLCNRADCM